MFLKQYYLGCLSHASYLIGDSDSGAAVVVDPQRDIDQYLKDAKENDLEIDHVVLTHFHADFLAGHLELRERTGAAIYLGARAEAEYAFTPLADGATIELGSVRLEALETPGHTPEGISIVVYDLDADREAPHGVLTGDTLFIGDVGRPDLMASIGVSAQELGEMLYDSLHDKLLKLPDDTLVYPAHGAGSMCGKHLSDEKTSTIGEQRRYNYALQPMTREKFVALVAAEQPEAPSYFAYDAMLNRKERATLEASLRESLNPLSVEDVLRRKNSGEQLVDARDPVDFEGAHFIDSINIGLGGQYATWAGTLLDADKPIVLVAEPGREQEAAMRLGRIGFDRVAGYLDGGMRALEERPDLVGSTPRITAAALRELLDDDHHALFVLDVRNPGEFAAGHVDGANNIPLNRLEGRLDELPRDRRMVVHCASGYRSSIAASILKRSGLDHVMDLVGGYDAWATTERALA